MSVYVFDVDGTLLDSMPAWEMLGERYLRKNGKRPKPGLADILRTMSYEQSALWLQENYLPDKTAEQITKELEALISGCYEREITEKPGACAYVQRLKEAGHRLFAASASRRAHIEAAFCRLGIIEYFEAIYTTKELGSKDTAEFYRKLSKQIKVSVQELTVWEDSYYAAVSAQEAGCRVYGIYDAAEPKGERLRQLAKRYVIDFKESRA